MGPYNFRINVFIEISLRIVYSELLFSAKKKLRKTIIMIKNVFSWYFHLPLRIHWRFLTILLKTQQTFVLVKTYWRRLEDVFSVTFFLSSKTSSRHNCKKSSWRHPGDVLKKTSWKLFEDVLRRRPEDVASWRCLQDVLKKFLEDILLLHLEDVFTRRKIITLKTS